MLALPAERKIGGGLLTRVEAESDEEIAEEEEGMGQAYGSANTRH